MELRERDMGKRERLMRERHGDQISKVLIKKAQVPVRHC